MVVSSMKPTSLCPMKCKQEASSKCLTWSPSSSCINNRQLRASPTQWAWVWANSVRWWRTRKPGMLQSMGSQRAGHDWATEQQLANHLVRKEMEWQFFQESLAWETRSGQQCWQGLSSCQKSHNLTQLPSSPHVSIKAELVPHTPWASPSLDPSPCCFFCVKHSSPRYRHGPLSHGLLALGDSSTPQV